MVSFVAYNTTCVEGTILEMKPLTAQKNIARHLLHVCFDENKFEQNEGNRIK